MRLLKTYAKLKVRKLLLNYYFTVQVLFKHWDVNANSVSKFRAKQNKNHIHLCYFPLRVLPKK
jgi:hypothetical protein